MTQIILARSLSHASYGVFALIFGVLLFLFTCQSSLIGYPLSLEGAVASKAQLKRLASASAFLTLLLAIPFSSLVIGATFVLHVAAIIWAVLLAMLLWQLQETFRRALMAHLRHGAAVWGDAFSYGGQAILVWLLARSGTLTLQRVFLVIAVTSALAAVIQSLQVGWSMMPLRATLAMARKYWSAGKWALFSGMNDSGARQVFPWLLALLYSPAEAASFQAVMNVVGVSHPVVFGTANLVVPAAADARHRSGTAAAFRVSSWYGVLAAIVVVPFFAILFFEPHAALALLYGKMSPYVHFGTGLRLASIAYMLAYAGGVAVAFLYGVGRAKFGFVASAGGAAVALISCAFLILHYGVAGAIAAILVAALGKLVISALLSARTLRLDADSINRHPSSSGTSDVGSLNPNGAPGRVVRVETGRTKAN